MPKEPAFYVRLSGDGVHYLNRLLNSGMAGGDKTLREAVKAEVGAVANQVRKLRESTILAAEKVANGEEAARASERGVPSYTVPGNERRGRGGASRDPQQLEASDADMGDERD